MARSRGDADDAICQLAPQVIATSKQDAEKRPDMMTLYYCPPGCSLASHVALEESGLDYTPHAVNVKDPKERMTLVKLNQTGKVPTLVVDGQVLTENVAILNYIATAAPGAKLVPDGSLARAQCISLLGWYASTVHIAFRQSFRPELFSEAEAAHDGIRKSGREGFWRGLQTMDSRLADQPFMMGERFSIADTYILVFYNWAKIGSYPVESLPNLTSCKDRLRQRPAVRKVLEREGLML
jgi:glutathione S-transferase